MSARPISCRSCGASSSTGAEFYFVQSATATAVEEIVAVRDDGTLELSGWADIHHSPHVGRDEIRCGSCDHQWRTTRPNPADSP